MAVSLRNVSRFIVGLTGLVGSTYAFGWGSIGHALIGKVAAEQTTVAKGFWLANSAAVGSLSTVPDAYWKRPSTYSKERANHWFQIDGYIDPTQFIPDLFLNYTGVVQQYSQAKVTANGTSSWRSEQMFSMAVEAFKRQDFTTGLEVVGALSHYIGDMSQPLHVTANYDGQLSGQTGIHKYFETTIIQKENQDSLANRVTDRAHNLLADANFHQQLDGLPELKLSYLESMRAALKINDVLRIDKDMGRNGDAAAKQMEIVIERLGDGAATLAFLLDRIAEEANLQDQSLQVKTAIPQWIPSEFQGEPAPLTKPMKKPEEDCF